MFGSKRTLLDSNRSQKALQRLDFGKTCFKDLVFARGEVLGFFGDTNESLRLRIIYYMFKYMFGKKRTLLDSYRRPRSPLKARFRQN